MFAATRSRMFAAAILAAGVVTASACCKYGDGGVNIFDGSGLNPILFGSPPPPVFQCILDNDFREDHFLAETNPGGTNIFGCNADHCYGESNCQGTADLSRPAQRLLIFWVDYRTDPVSYPEVTRCPEMKPYMRCDGNNVVPRDRDCADRDLVLSEPANATVARLTAVFCDPADTADVGYAFAGEMLATLDADQSGDVDCAEWGIAKKRTKFEDLRAGYFGPSKVRPPACKLSKKGAQELAAFNAYLAELTADTLKANGTAWLKHAAHGAAAKVEGLAVGNALVGKFEAAKEAVEAKLNATVVGKLEAAKEAVEAKLNATVAAVKG